MAGESDTATILWRSLAGGNFRWFEAGEEYVAYHRPSGTTHLLNSASVLLLDDILRTPRTAAEASQALGMPELADDIIETLERFEDLGFVERS